MASLVSATNGDLNEEEALQRALRESKALHVAEKQIQSDAEAAKLLHVKLNGAGVEQMYPLKKSDPKNPKKIKGEKVRNQTASSKYVKLTLKEGDTYYSYTKNNDNGVNAKSSARYYKQIKQADGSLGPKTRVSWKEYSSNAKVGGHKIDCGFIAKVINKIPGPPMCDTKLKAAEKIFNDSKWAFRKKSITSNKNDSSAEKKFGAFVEKGADFVWTLNETAKLKQYINELPKLKKDCEKEGLGHLYKKLETEVKQLCKKGGLNQKGNPDGRLSSNRKGGKNLDGSPDRRLKSSNNAKSPGSAKTVRQQPNKQNTKNDEAIARALSSQVNNGAKSPGSAKTVRVKQPTVYSGSGRPKATDYTLSGRLRRAKPAMVQKATVYSGSGRPKATDYTASGNLRRAKPAMVQQQTVYSGRGRPRNSDYMSSGMLMWPSAPQIFHQPTIYSGRGRPRNSDYMSSGMLNRGGGGYGGGGYGGGGGGTVYSGRGRPRNSDYTASGRLRR